MSGPDDSTGSSGSTGSTDSADGTDSGADGGTRPLPLLEKRPKNPDGLDQSASAASYTPVLTPPEGGEHRRRWSVRRWPAVVVGLLGLGAAGLLLYDVAAVRADRPAMRWRHVLGEQLDERPLDDLWLLIGAGAAALLGLWLLLLAVTPGHRSTLAMNSGQEDVYAWLDAEAAALVLRDRAMEVPGVRSVRVRVRRARVDVRAVAHFRELDDVRADLDTVLGDGIAALGLSRSPGLRVRVDRPGKRG
ncbi:DUF6286 domain-containing protein [Streptomyces sp. LHD-70]|uniref:DUF6286 domain-containing protein n=1 Tax=Streptomyces sp. LHD-70 TaxID=3072140 RepID=UPI00280FD6D1|nr:DUF6286 domain-containing protein [Streptomyces sp. LHD-70]MDQ8701785.1 DUF6286 domain-containing protein [Streptomyces sp. LHD-70]